MIKITKREKRIIIEHLKSLRKLNSQLPYQYRAFDNITEIRYSVFKRTITTEMIKQIKIEECL